MAQLAKVLSLNLTTEVQSPESTWGRETRLSKVSSDHMHTEACKSKCMHRQNK